MLSTLGFAFILLIAGVIVALIKRGQRRWQLVQRRRHISQSNLRSSVIVLLHSVKDSLQTAGLINLMLRQASRPLGIQFHVLEELKNSSQGDSRQHYIAHHNTIDDHRNRIRVHTTVRQNRALPPAKAFLTLLRGVLAGGSTGLIASDTTVVWINALTTFVVQDWDLKILQSIQRSPNSLLTSVPLNPTLAPTNARAVLGTQSFVTDEDLGGGRRGGNNVFGFRILFPYLDRKGRLQSRFAARAISPTMPPPRVPILHPCLVCGRLSVFKRFKFAQKEEQPNSDLDFTKMFPGMRFALFPFNLISCSFVPVQKQSKSKFPPPSTDIQLGMWPENPDAKAERLLGIILRYGSEQEFKHLWQKVSAFQQQ